MTVLEHLDLAVPANTILGIVGESGSGKSTLARVIAGLVTPKSGSVALDGRILGARRSRREARRIQMAFQDPTTSLNPRLRVEQTLADACQVPRSGRVARVQELLASVGLEQRHGRAYPHELSGGQRQRVSLARAIAAEPDVLICDEVTSALDVSTRGTILNLIVNLQRQHGFTLLFISHDIGAVRRISDHVAVMYAGQIVEAAPAHAVAKSPQHPYTRVLLDAVPSIDRPHRLEVIDFEPVDPRDPPTGCRFHPRCPVGPQADPGRGLCASDDPTMGARQRTHRSACHYSPDADADADADPDADPAAANVPHADPPASAPLIAERDGDTRRSSNTPTEMQLGAVDVTR